MKGEQLLRAHPLVLSSSCCGLSHYTEFNVRPYVERRTTSRDDFSLLAPYKPLSRVHEYVVNILLFFRYFSPRKSVFIEKIIAIDHAVDRVATASPASSTISPPCLITNICISTNFGGIQWQSHQGEYGSKLLRHSCRQRYTFREFRRAEERVSTASRDGVNWSRIDCPSLTGKA